MSATSAKAARRDIRRAAGQGALATIAEMQRNIERLANSLTLAHRRSDELTHVCARLEARIAYLETELKMRFVPDGDRR